jgi:hypothetical protein
MPRMEPSERSPLAATTATELSPGQLLSLARGFSCILWGIPVSLLLAFGVFIFRPAMPIQVPPYVIGLLIIYWGLILLRRTKPPTTRWLRYVGLALLSIFLEVYFAPFAAWWVSMPELPWYAANMLGLFVCTIWALVLINKLVGEAARAFHDRSFFVEAQLCAWSAILCTAMPAFVILLFSLHMSARVETSVYAQIWTVHERLHYWIYVLFLLPFTLTMACAWKVKETALRRLAESAARAAFHGEC